jgi:hypothetical protein
MAYTIEGMYVASCDCRGLCPCPVDGPPTSSSGECNGALVFHVERGNLDDTDLSGVDFALFNHFPSNLTSGNWKIGVVVDDGASDDQAQAVERIVSGQEGGPFGEFVPLIGEYLGLERASVELSGGRASVGGKTEMSFEPLTGPDGSATTVKNAMFGFAPEFTVGKSSGKSDAFGMSSEFSYGESADYTFSSEMTGEVHPRG